MKRFIMIIFFLGASCGPDDRSSKERAIDDCYSEMQDRALLARCPIEPPDVGLCEELERKSVVTVFEANWWHCRAATANCAEERPATTVCGEQGWCIDELCR